jgi:hypothetical protein
MCGTGCRKYGDAFKSMLLIKVIAITPENAGKIFQCVIAEAYRELDITLYI